MKYMYITTGIKREFVRFGMDCRRYKLSGLLEEGWWPSILVDRLFFNNNF